MTRLLSGKKIIVALIMFVLLGVSSTVYAYSYTNSKIFINVQLPHGHANTTFVSGKKTTGRNYGRVTVTKIGGGSAGVNVWLRSKKSNGSWDSLESKMRTFTSSGTKMVYYTNSSTGYKIPYAKGTSVQLRGENKTNTTVIKDNVSGNVCFN